MDLGLQDKGIIITGGSKGIGFSIAAACAKEGAWVSICGRTQSSLDEAAEKLKVHGGKVHTAVCDIGEADAIAAYVDAAASALGGLYGLVNNPSGFGNSDNEDGWQKGIDIDLMGVVRTTWAATPHLKANGGGSILNISSISGLAASGNISYGAVKAAVIQLTQSHAKAMAADNIRVNCIAPLAGTRMTATVMPAEVVEALKPEYVAPIVGFLAHDSCEDNGGLYEVGAGYVCKLRW